MLLPSICLELTLLLTFWLVLGVWSKDPSTPGRTTFIGLGLATMCWCAGELAVMRDALPEVWADRLRYLGVLTVPPLWAGLAAQVSRLELARRAPWFPVVLAGPMAVPFGLMFSERWSGLFLITMVDAPDVYGPLWYVALAYNYTLVMTGSLALIWCAVRPGRGAAWSHRLAIGVAPLVPLAGNVFYVMGGMDGYDPTPMLFGVALFALRSGIFAGSLLEALPVSQHAILDQLPLGIILTDRRGVVLTVNPVAERQLGVRETHAIGRTLDAVLSGSASDLQADVNPLRTGDHEAGQLVLLGAPGKPGA